MIKYFAREFVLKNNINDFKGTDGWWDKFKKNIA